MMLSLLNLSSIGVRLPIQISSANTAPVASIFMPDTVTPASSSATTCRFGSSRSCPGNSSVARMPVGGITAKQR